MGILNLPCLAEEIAVAAVALVAMMAITVAAVVDP